MAAKIDDGFAVPTYDVRTTILLLQDPYRGSAPSYAPLYSLRSHSQPFCIWRNTEAYRVGAKGFKHFIFENSSNGVKPHVAHEAAWLQTMLYKDRLAEHPIPGFLLEGTIYNEMMAQASSSNTRELNEKIYSSSVPKINAVYRLNHFANVAKAQRLAKEAKEREEAEAEAEAEAEEDEVDVELHSKEDNNDEDEENDNDFNGDKKGNDKIRYKKADAQGDEDENENENEDEDEDYFNLSDDSEEKTSQRQKRRKKTPSLPPRISYTSGPKQTLVGCMHNDQQLLIHAAGKNLDDLILRRRVDCCFPLGSVYSTRRGFTYSLGNGSSVEQILCCTDPKMSCNGGSNLLVRTVGSEVTHIRTVSLDDHVPQEDFKKHSRSWKTFHSQREDSNLKNAFILEPVQKFQLPCDIACMSTSHFTWTQAAVLGRGGELFTWTPLEGLVRRSSPSHSIFPSLCGSISSADRMLVASTLHPMIHYISHSSTILTHDIRSRSVASPSLIVSNGVIESICQHGLSPHHYLISHGKRASLIDSRYTKECMAYREVPDGAHSNLLFKSSDSILQHSQGGSDNGLFVGCGDSARQIITHSIDLEGRGYHTNDNGYDNMDYDSSDHNYTSSSAKAFWQRALFSALSPFGSANHVCWSLSGFPVVDRSANARTCGVDLLPCPIAYRERRRKSVGEKGRGERDEEGSHNDEDEEDDDDDDVGDDVGDGDKDNDDPKSREIRGALLVHQNSLGDVFAQRLQYPRRDWNNGQWSTTSSSPSYLTSSSLAPPPPPIQLHIPCGVRCFPPENPLDGNIMKEFYPDKFHTKGEIPGLHLERSGSYRDYDSNAYPLPSRSFVPFVEEASLKPFDVVKFNTSEMRSDLPPFRRDVNKRKSLLTLIRAPRPLVQDKGKAQELFSMYEKSLLHSLSVQSMTLWEVWRFYYEASGRERIRLDYLRELLTLRDDIKEELLHTFPLGNRQVNPLPDIINGISKHSTADLSSISATIRSSSSSSSSSDTPPASSVFYSIDGCQVVNFSRAFTDVKLPTTSTSTATATATATTSNGEGEGDDEPKHTAGSATAGSATSADSEDGNGNAKKVIIEEDEKEKRKLLSRPRCHCVVRHDVDVKSIQLCRWKDCIIPHLLVYSSDKTFTQNIVSPSQSAATTTSTSKSSPLPNKRKREKNVIDLEVLASLKKEWSK